MLDRCPALPRFARISHLLGLVTLAARRHHPHPTKHKAAHLSTAHTHLW